jgi:hypothetical protein
LRIDVSPEEVCARNNERIEQVCKAKGITMEEAWNLNGMAKAHGAWTEDSWNKLWLKFDWFTCF